MHKEIIRIKRTSLGVGGFSVMNVGHMEMLMVGKDFTKMGKVYHGNVDSRDGKGDGDMDRLERDTMRKG